ncbi:GumC family protein [Novosphingobium decolorationis]|uniref:non-specific protein-tyrosine kinase n=1 Tax=Novosphingobium decolorationis TaxID=2698673 RepID=A0ABX8E2Z7_9SPHN|nr:AAA family ATPase [Novosphingobium decolorationis]QVM83288.1 AAA family ATPase [Novosphingobium decolorationis]
MNLPALYEPQGRPPQLLARDTGTYREEDGEDAISVRFLFAMLMRRREVVVLTLALCVLLALVFTSAQSRIYSASADVVMITGDTQIAPEDEGEAREGPTRAEDVETQIQLIRSRDMAGQVLEATGLEEDPTFRADVLEPRSMLDNLLGSVGLSDRQGGSQEIDAGTLRERAVTYLIKRIHVVRVGNSFNLRIEFSDVDAARTAQVVNTYARLYTLDDLQERARGSAEAAKTLREKVAELSETANAAFAKVQAYRVANGLISSSATGLTEQEISTYNQQVASARAEAARDAAALQSARSQMAVGGAGNVGSAASSPVVASLRAQRAQLVTRERDLSQRYFDENPELVTVRRQISDLDTQIAAEVNRSLQALSTQARASAQRLSSLLASRNGTRAQLGADNTALVALAGLEKEADAAQSLYRSYLEQLNKVVAGSGTERPAARLISAANVPGLPVSPNLALNLALGAVAGIFAGALLAIVSEISYRGFTTMEDVEKRLGVPGLGAIPAFATVQPHSASPLETVRDFPDGAFSEALRNVIVSVRYLTGGAGRVIALASSVPGEGKTTLSACLGRSLATAGEKVVVVDCDVIRMQLSRMFAFDNGQPGLMEALAAEDSPIPCYEEPQSEMRIVPITRAFAKGERLTERGRFARMVARLREDYDVVLLDCPPVLPIAETRDIIACADATLLVVGWRKTTDRVVRAAMRLLPARARKNLGVVLNKVDMEKQVRFGGDDAASFYTQYAGYYR